MWVKIFWVAPRRIFWWLVTVFAPGRFVHFALIYPAKIVDDGPMTATHGGANAWADLGIVNVGAVPFDPSTIQVSVAIGNNNYPGPASVGADHEGPPYQLNPGEVAGHCCGQTLAAIRRAIPEATVMSPHQYFGLTTRIGNAGGPTGVAFADTSGDLNYTVRLGSASVKFTTVYVNGHGPTQHLTETPGFVYSS